MAYSAVRKMVVGVILIPSIAALTLLISGCADTQGASGVDAKGQAWSITLNERLEAVTLPKTPKMELLGGNLTAYIKDQCEPLETAQICDVYAQVNPTGSLVGYLTISGSDAQGYLYSTDTLTNRNEACLLGGVLENIEGNPAADFRGRSPFTYVENGSEAGGMIYLEKKGQNLRVNDERWNYCYSDRHIDDTYVFLGSLVRSAPKTAFKAAVEKWVCDFGDPRGSFNIALNTNTYQFTPYNPDGGALSGQVNVLKEESWNGEKQIGLEFVGSGAPSGRWGFVQDPGKRKALLTYAVESSGDASECVPPGEQPQYVFN